MKLLVTIFNDFKLQTILDVSRVLSSPLTTINQMFPNKRAISRFFEAVALIPNRDSTCSKSTKETLKTLEQDVKCVNSKDSRMTPMKIIWCLYCLASTDFTHVYLVFLSVTLSNYMLAQYVKCRTEFILDKSTQVLPTWISHLSLTCNFELRYFLSNELVALY